MSEEKPSGTFGMKRFVWLLLCLILLAAAAVCMLAVTRLSGAQQRIQTLEQQVSQLEAGIAVPDRLAEHPLIGVGAASELPGEPAELGVGELELLAGHRALSAHVPA